MNKINVIIDCVDNVKRSVAINKDNTVLVVRTNEEEVFLKAVSESPLSYGEMYSFNRERGVFVFRFNDHSTCKAAKEKIETLNSVKFAGYGFVNIENNTPLIYTGNIIVIFKSMISHEECHQFLRENNLVIKEELNLNTKTFFVTPENDKGDKVFEFSNQLNTSDKVMVCHPELLTTRTAFAIHNNQWHLKKTTIKYEAEIDQSANVEDAHKHTEGAGVIIAIIDDGVDIRHPEFSGKLVGEQNFSTGNKKNPSPRRGDLHGTACAGIACASGIFGASGVAPQARLMPLRLVEDIGSYLEAKAFIWAVDHGADIISCSWGPKDSVWANSHKNNETRKIMPMPASTRLALEYAREKGRNGKGCIIVFAAGNGNESVDRDMYASNENVIAVASCNDRGKRCVYSDYGKAIWCCFPSGDLYDFHLNPYLPLSPGIWTTDISLKNRGYNKGDIHLGDSFGNYINNFSGTSASCPGVAGVAALMLSVAPELKAQQVKDIIKQTCTKIGKIGAGYDRNGHSIYYGYGRIDAAAAVESAMKYSSAMGNG
ncbi:S8 family peptidase [Enterobacter asburiae]